MRSTIFLVGLIGFFAASCSDMGTLDKRTKNTEIDGFRVQKTSGASANYNLSNIYTRSNIITKKLYKPCSEVNGNKLCIGDRFFQKILVHSSSNNFSFDNDFNFGTDYINMDFESQIACAKPGYSNYNNQEAELEDSIISSCLTTDGAPVLQSLEKGEVNFTESFISHKIEIAHDSLADSVKTDMWVHYLSEAGHVYLVNPCQVINHDSKNQLVQCAFGASQAYALGSVYATYVDSNSQDWSTLTKREKGNKLRNIARTLSFDLGMFAASIIVFGLVMEAALPAALELIGFTSETASLISTSIEAGFAGQIATSAAIDLSDSIKKRENCKSRQCKVKQSLVITADALMILMSTVQLGKVSVKFFEGNADAQNLLTQKVYLDFDKPNGLIANAGVLTKQKMLANLIAINDEIKTLTMRIDSLHKKGIISEASKNDLSEQIVLGPQKNESIEDFLIRIDNEVSKSSKSKFTTSNCPLNLTCPTGTADKIGIPATKNTYKVSKAINQEATKQNYDYNYFYDLAKIDQSKVSKGSKKTDYLGTIPGLDGQFIFRFYKPQIKPDHSITKYLSTANMEMGYKHSIIPQLVAFNENSAIFQKLPKLKAAHMSSDAFKLGVLHEQHLSMMQALEFIHKPTSKEGTIRFIAHRNIKLENMIQQGENEKSIGFFKAGINNFDYAESLTEGGSLDEVNRTIHFVGTPRTLDPNIVSKDILNEKVSFSELMASDIWSMGITMLELAFEDADFFYTDILRIREIGRQAYYPVYMEDGEIRSRIEKFFQKEINEIMDNNENLTETQVLGMKEFVNYSRDFEIIMEMLNTNPASRPSASEVVESMRSSAPF